MRFVDEGEALNFVFKSLKRMNFDVRGPDEATRDTAPTVRLLQARDLLTQPREYAVVTGSKGKGSTVAIMAKLLQHLGHTVGMVTSPHLVSFRERIRVNGRAIPEPDFLRILSDLAPDVEKIDAVLTEKQYFSPQGIFLATALTWFDEMDVNAAVLEVGRGGRYDDIAVVPNRLSLFTPILLEHPKQLGPTLDRIAWHKAGIIKQSSYAYSVPQAAEVLRVLQAEADAQDAEFAWIAPTDMGEYLGTTENGIRFRLGRYGELILSMLGRYEVDNATLAVQGVGNMHSRLAGPSHGSAEYVEAIRAGLADVNWPGRLQKLQDSPVVYVDGATNVNAARSVLRSLEGRLTHPLVTIVATPIDRDYEGVYRVFGEASDRIVLTETDINPNIRFPDATMALAVAAKYNPEVSYASTLSGALDRAYEHAGKDGTLLLAVAQPLVGEAMQLWGLSFETI
jgi:dihydrofolate synthase/folylpolyglutamate synthase